MNKDSRWWLEEKNGAHHSLVENIHKVRELEEGRHKDMLKFLRMYGGRAYSGVTSTSYYRNEVGMSGRERMQMNVIRSCIDSVVAKLSHIKTAPTFVTTKGDYGKYRQAKQLNQFCTGLFYRNHVYRDALLCLRDAAITGTGALKIYPQGDDIKTERVHPFELFVDPRESMYGDPRSLYQVRPMDRKVLQEEFPLHASAIEDSSGWLAGDPEFLEHHPDQVLVVEAWHLPSGPKAKDGRHVIAVSGGTLWDEEWTSETFPFAFVRYSVPPLGFWGTSLAEEIYPIQVELNTLLRRVQTAFDLGSHPTIFLPRGSQIKKSQITNQPFSIVETSGAPFEVKTYGTVHPEVFQHIERLHERAYQIPGVSQLAAQSQKPAGLESGKALLVYEDIQAERFAVVAETYKNFFMDIAKLCINQAKSLKEKGVDVEVKASIKSRQRRFISSIKWSQVNLDDDSYEMQMLPSSSLPNRIEGRQTIIERWLQAGFIDKTQALALMDMPDVEGFANLELASYDNVLAAMESILDDGEYVSPEPHDDLMLCVKLGTSVYQRARLDGVPEERRSMLLDYIAAAEALLSAAQASMAPPPEAMPPEGAPQ